MVRRRCAIPTPRTALLASIGSNNRDSPASIVNLKDTIQTLDLGNNPLDKRGNEKTGKDRTLGKKELKEIFKNKIKLEYRFHKIMKQIYSL